MGFVRRLSHTCRKPRLKGWRTLVQSAKVYVLIPSVSECLATHELRFLFFLGGAGSSEPGKIRDVMSLKLVMDGLFCLSPFLIF